MSEYRWYWAYFAELDTTAMPDFSRVPEDKRAVVEANWLARQECRTPVLYKVWEPQIPMYLTSVYADTRVTILGPVEDE